jgi:hypothetical protein
MAMLLRYTKLEDVTVHRFQSSFRDWAGDETSLSREIVEAAFAHVIGDKAEQAYRRGDAHEKNAVSSCRLWQSFAKVKRQRT